MGIGRRSFFYECHTGGRRILLSEIHYGRPFGALAYRAGQYGAGRRTPAFSSSLFGAGPREGPCGRKSLTFYHGTEPFYIKNPDALGCAIRGHHAGGRAMELLEFFYIVLLYSFWLLAGIPEDHRRD